MSVKLLKYQKSIFIENWGSTYTVRGDNNFYSIFIPGVYLDGYISIQNNMEFLIAAFDGNVVRNVNTLAWINKRENGIEITMRLKDGVQINYGIAIPTTDFYIIGNT